MPPTLACVCDGEHARVILLLADAEHGENGAEQTTTSAAADSLGRAKSEQLSKGSGKILEEHFLIGGVLFHNLAEACNRTKQIIRRTKRVR